MTEAHRCYSEWGSTLKVNQIQSKFPDCTTNKEKKGGQEKENGGNIEHMDQNTLVKVAEAISLDM